MNEQNPTSGTINVEKLMSRVAELEEQNKALLEKVTELTDSIETLQSSNEFLRTQNAKCIKALTGIKSLAELMLP